MQSFKITLQLTLNIGNFRQKIDPSPSSATVLARIPGLRLVLSVIISGMATALILFGMGRVGRPSKD